MLTDTFGRQATNLRISITDRCNLRCSYCLPEEVVPWIPRAEILTFEEIERLVQVLAPLGVCKLRITGGEPLLRKDLPELIRRLALVSGIKDIAMTTNGVGLRRLAGPLREAGLGRVNISLDTTDAKAFRRMTRRDQLPQVLDGIRAAAEVGFTPVKINAVVQRDQNLDAVLPLARMAREQDLVLRFIEYMPLDRGQGWSNRQVVPNREILELLSAIGPLERVAHDGPAEAAERWRWIDGKGEIGLIGSVSEPFCDSCNRIRVTAEGKFRTCLFSHDEHDLRALLRGGASDEEIAAKVAEAVRGKEAGHLIGRPGFIQPSRTMSSIGG